MSPDGGEDTVDGIVGVNLAYEFDNGPALYLDGEGQIGLDRGDTQDNLGGTFRFGLRWKL